MNELIPMEFNGQKVLTTELLADIYETDINNIQVNFKNHKKNFKQGKHFYLLQGEELKDFKSHLNNIQIPNLISKFTSQLYLWTERGANRHCKILDTDKAWEQFDNLEETYFRVKKNVQVLNSNLDLLIKFISQLPENEIKKIVSSLEVKSLPVKTTKEVLYDFLASGIGILRQTIKGYVETDANLMCEFFEKNGHDKFKAIKELKEENLIEPNWYGNCIQTQLYNGTLKSVIVIKMIPSVKFYECN